MSVDGSVFHKLLAVAAWLVLFSSPYFLKPYYGTFLAWIGGEFAANVYGNVLVAGITLITGNLYYYCLYRDSKYDKYRISKKPWPWNDKPDIAASFSSTLLNGFGLAVLNLVLTVPVGVGGYDLVKKLGYTASEESFPGPLTIFWQILLFMVIEDALFYWGHRALHHPSIYGYIHKVHHRFTYSVSIAATATHPVEYFISNIVPFVAGPTLLGAHCVTLYVWVVFRQSETITNHSGYALPWSMFSLLPFQGSATDHDLHHSKNTGNFGSLFNWWDWFCGTALVDEGRKSK